MYYFNFESFFLPSRKTRTERLWSDTFDEDGNVLHSQMLKQMTQAGIFWLLYIEMSIKWSFLLVNVFCHLNYYESPSEITGWSYRIRNIQGDWKIWCFVTRKEALCENNTYTNANIFSLSSGTFHFDGTALWACQSQKHQPSIKCAHIFIY